MYHVLPREVAAVFLLGDKFTVYTDIIACKWFFTKKQPSPKLLRWFDTSSQYTFDVFHRAGRTKEVADALPRPVVVSAIIIAGCDPAVAARIKALYAFDPDCQCILQQLHENPSNKNKDPKFVIKFWQALMANMHVELRMTVSHRAQADEQSEQQIRIFEDALHSASNACLFLEDRPPAIDYAKDQLSKAQARQKRYYDKHRSHTTFKLSDFVYVRERMPNKAFSTPEYDISIDSTKNKLLPRWVDPFPTTKRIGENSYKLILPCTLKSHDVFKVDQLKSYIIENFYWMPATIR
ncbi:unnamed protein product [Phytophthora fragariaefolia]|uniref:Unnamed protein product n=1 Tax=Phytophthora fragariaefolia TaxID=1490495 RepID=A0A9W6X3Q2_9STRA|nr:unnamed protein product [Phytophthora fragariaefolia]